ncbi:MAG: trypsin-like peptidase domain-containing protein [Nodosilinea sp.]
MNRFVTLGLASMGLALAAVPFAQVNLPWRAEAHADDAATTTIPILTDVSALGFELEASQTTIPAGLSQSDNPSEGGRIIIGPDNRQPMTSSSYPWSAVGQIVGFTSEGSYTCTGTLVADDLVLTNAHCVVDPATGMYSQRIMFLPNLVNGRLTNDDDIATVTGVLVGTDFAEDRFPEPDDWALMRIDKPLGQIYGTIGLSPLPTEVLLNEPFAEQLIMVGYSGDFPADNPGQTASAHKGCSIVEEALSVVLHLCDTTGGASGGPILALIDDEYRIVALHAAGRTNRETGEGVVNFAVTVPRIMSQLQVEAP